jgi:hypothetical protein
MVQWTTISLFGNDCISIECQHFRSANLSPKDLYTVPKAMDDFIVNNEKKKHSAYGMKSFIPWDDCFLHFIINNEIIYRFWDSVVDWMLLVLKATHHFLHGKKSKLHISYHI